jgi:hypothetical protein
MNRQCSECQLCCRLLPMQANSDSEYHRYPHAIAAALATGLAVPGVPAFDKPAGARCPHQRHHKGCAVHGHHPFGCQIWNCGWLANDGTKALRRPDRAGYVIDILPDFVTLTSGDEKHNIEVVVIWADPKCPNAWREDAALLDYLNRLGVEGKAVQIRFNEREAIIAFPPTMSSDGQWHEVPLAQCTNVPQRSPKELFAGLAECRKVAITVPE